MKHRAGFGSGNNGRLADQGKAYTTKGGGGGRFPDGVFDSFWPDEKSIWIHILKNQSYTQKLYNPESGEVEEGTKSWFTYVKHYYATKKQTTYCSCGPARTEPCYPCAVRRAFYTKQNAIEERTGVKPDGEPPISGAKAFAFSIVMMEPMVVVEKPGRNGKVYKNFVPAVRAQIAGGPQKPIAKFGHRCHWSLGILQLRQVFQFDEEMRNYCAHCARNMAADAVICIDCESVYDLPELTSGEDLVEVRQRPYKCGNCQYEGPMQPRLICECGDPVEGKLTDFDLRVKKEKLSDNQSILHIKSVRLPRLEDPEVAKLCESPMDLPAIFAPTNIGDQRKKLGDLCNNIDPRKTNREDEGGATAPEATSYSTPEDETGDLSFSGDAED